MITETFTTPSGEERTVQYSGALSKRQTGKYRPPVYVQADPSFHAKDEPSDECGDSTFHNKSSGGSPLVADCQCLIDWLRQNNGWFSVSPAGSGFAAFAHCGTCTFGAHTKNIMGTVIGNTDIADIVQDSIKRFEWEGRVGAEGDMGCYSVLDTARVEWAVLHS